MFVQKLIRVAVTVVRSAKADWGNTARADMARLGSINIIMLTILINIHFDH